MKYIETLFYLFFYGAALLLLFKLVVVYPALGMALGFALLWVGWELACGLDD